MADPASVTTFRDYKSPFKLPLTDTSRCTNPGEHLRYPDSHAENLGRYPWGKRCPLHNPERRNPETCWELWYKYREQFANGESDSAWAYSQMLSYVTETNPPDAPYKNRQPKKNPEHASFFTAPLGHPDYQIHNASFFSGAFCALAFSFIVVMSVLHLIGVY